MIEDQQGSARNILDRMRGTSVASLGQNAVRNVLAYAPRPVVRRLFTAFDRFALERQFQQLGEPTPTLPDPRKLAPELPVPLKRAFEALGGYGRVFRSLRRLHRLGMATTGAIWSARPQTTASCVRVEGFDLISAASREGKRVIIVEPHIGPPFNLIAQLLDDGFGVSNFSLTTKEEEDVFRQAAQWLRPFRRSDAHEAIIAWDPSASVLALRALRHGRLLIWQPDVLESLPASTRHRVQVELLGERREVSTLVYELGRNVDATYVLGFGRLERSWNPALTIRYRPLSLTTTSPEAFMRELYQSADAVIMENLDQWWRWEVYPNI